MPAIINSTDRSKTSQLSNNPPCSTGFKIVKPLLSGHLSKCKLCAILNGFSMVTLLTLLQPILTFPNEILGVFANMVKLKRGLSLAEPDRRSVCGVHGPYHLPWLGVVGTSIFSLIVVLKLSSEDHIVDKVCVKLKSLLRTVQRYNPQKIHDTTYFQSNKTCYEPLTAKFQKFD